jgi:Rps23 Pro-64 3,4-dihydroxylase Tpa1-like proline 4-hydroxylase
MENKKLNNDYLIKINELDNKTIIKKFGDWVNNISELKFKFINGEPFEHVVIDNFLCHEYAEEIFNLFPTNYEEWFNYCNPIEVKYAFDNIENLNEKLKNYFYYLSSNCIINLIKEISSITNLEYDEYLHGAGLHSHGTNGRLNVHLDYEKHPYSGKERRLNIIYFTTKDWNPLWNGHNELWNKDISECVKKTEVKFNRAIIFKTNEISWHGLHKKITCPENIFRKSLAYYYVSNLDSEKQEMEYRKKAKYVKCKNEEYCEKMDKLFKIREKRLITEEDLKEIIPEWKKEN